MVLTGPVLRHRQVIGELGQVKIYFDASESMTMQDGHMSTGRKLLIAEQLGWLGEGKLDASLFHAADRLRAARQEFIQRIAGQELTGRFRHGTQRSQAVRRVIATSVDPAAVETARNQFLNDLKPVPDLLGDSRRTLPVDGKPVAPSASSFSVRLSTEVVEPLQALTVTPSDEGCPHRLLSCCPLQTAVLRLRVR